MDQDSDQLYTPAAAAKHAGCGRSSIMRALQSKELLGDRDNRNRWKISRQALETWMKSRPVTDRSSVVTDPDTDRDTARSQVWSDLAAAEATIEELRARITENDRRHDAEIQRLERIIERLSTPAPSLIQRIFGASPRS